jgi:hypothetical protein
MIKFLNWLGRVLPSRMIECEKGVPYLFRVKLIGFMPGGKRDSKFNLYLHRFYRDDLDRYPHSHPWTWSFSLILTGGYEEERLINGKIVTRFVHPWTINILGPKDFHRVTSLNGEVWTLFFAGPKFADWGFMVKGKFVPHKQFIKESGR